MTDRLGPAFRVQREFAGVTIREISRRSWPTINHATISRWERGERDIADKTYDRLVSVLAAIINEPNEGSNA